MEYEKVLKFWFEEIDSSMHYKKDPEFDERIISEFGELHEKAVTGKLEDWKKNADGTLAFIVLIDQFSRNMFRDTKEMFEYDPIALKAAKEGIAKGFDNLVKVGRAFFYLPLMHSEKLEDQDECVKIFEELEKQEPGKFGGNVKYAHAHRDIVARFGRFPHRNEILGRESTEEEVEFLKGPGSHF